MNTSHQSKVDSSQDQSLPDNLNSPQVPSQDGQSLNVQDLFDGLLNYISCTTGDIIQTATLLQEGCSEAKLVLEKLKKNDLLDRDLDTKKPRNNNVPRLDQNYPPSLLGKRSNPFIDIDKETVLQPDLESNDIPEIIISQRIIEEESAESIDLESNDESADTEEYDADLSTSTDSSCPPPKTYADQATQTSPIVPVNFLPSELNFLGPFSQPQFTFARADNHSKSQEQNFNENDNGFIAEKLLIPLPPVRIPQGQLVFIQPVYFIQPIQILNHLAHPLQVQSSSSPPSQEQPIEKIQEM